MEFNAADLFEAVVDQIPDREAIILGPHRLTFADLEQRSNRAAHALQALGIGNGDHLGIYAYNCIEWVETMMGAYKLGAIPINVNYRYTEKELAYLIDNADMKALIYQRQFSPLLAPIRAQLPKLTHYIYIPDESEVSTEALQALDYAELTASASAERGFAPRSGNDIYVLYTGGTTGMPKGVMWRQEDVIMALGGGVDLISGKAFASPEEMSKKCLAKPLTPLALAPLMHGAAQWQVLNSLFSGWRLVFNDQRSFDAEYVWELVERERVEQITVTGDAMTRPLADALPKALAHRDLSSLGGIVSTAAVFSPSIKDRFMELMPNLIVLDGVGASETGATGMSFYTPGSREKDSGGGPRINPGRDTTVLHPETRRPLPPGSSEPGLLARSGNVPIGYYKDPQKSAETFFEVDGVRYAMPGDWALRHEDGTITLLGRGSVSINSGGEKIFPEEVETALKAHPDVFDCLVVGVPDERWGQRVAAVLAPRPGTSPTLEDLQQHAGKYIAGFKKPRYLVPVKEIVRSPSGKPDYAWATEQARAGWEREQQAAETADTADAPRKN